MQGDQLSPVATISRANSISSNVTRSAAVSESTPIITNNNKTTIVAFSASNSTPQTSVEQMESTQKPYKN